MEELGAGAATDDGTDEDAGGAAEDSTGADDDAGAAMDEGDSATEEAPLPPVGDSPERTHPVLSVSAFGQVTCL